MERTGILRLGTRGSLLARAQSNSIAIQLRARFPGLDIQTVIISTTGDRITDRPLYEEGGKGLFTKELEQALLKGEIDFAVHSCKDMPVTQPLIDESGLVIASTPARADCRDLLICDRAGSIAQLPPGARVATGSLRRRCQLLALRGDLQIQPVRGNIDTRLKKIRAGEFDAMVLAVAGIERAGLMESNWMHPIPLHEMLPCAGQGALALQCRRDDAETIAILQALNDAETHACISAERAVVAGLHGDCHSPIGAIAQIKDFILHLRVSVGRRGGELPVVLAEAKMPVNQQSTAVLQVLASLESSGATALLH
jgi:hydroxymethylbilane synthase